MFGLDLRTGTNVNCNLFRGLDRESRGDDEKESAHF